MSMTELERRRTIKSLKAIINKDIEEEKIILSDYLNSRIICNKESYTIEISGPITISYCIKQMKLSIRNKICKYSSRSVDLKEINRFKSILDSWAKIEFGGLFENDR